MLNMVQIEFRHPNYPLSWKDRAPCLIEWHLIPSDDCSGVHARVRRTNHDTVTAVHVQTTVIADALERSNVVYTCSP